MSKLRKRTVQSAQKVQSEMAGVPARMLVPCGSLCRPDWVAADAERRRKMYESAKDPRWPGTIWGGDRGQDGEDLHKFSWQVLRLPESVGARVLRGFGGYAADPVAYVKSAGIHSDLWRSANLRAFADALDLCGRVFSQLAASWVRKNPSGDWRHCLQMVGSDLGSRGLRKHFDLLQAVMELKGVGEIIGVFSVLEKPELRACMAPVCGGLEMMAAVQDGSRFVYRLAMTHLLARAYEVKEKVEQLSAEGGA
jgi:hypothetical protein